MPYGYGYEINIRLNCEIKFSGVSVTRARKAKREEDDSLSWKTKSGLISNSVNVWPCSFSELAPRLFFSPFERENSTNPAISRNLSKLYLINSQV